MASMSFYSSMPVTSSRTSTFKRDVEQRNRVTRTHAHTRPTQLHSRNGREYPDREDGAGGVHVILSAGGVVNGDRNALGAQNRERADEKKNEQGSFERRTHEMIGRGEGREVGGAMRADQISGTQAERGGAVGKITPDGPTSLRLGKSAGAVAERVHVCATHREGEESGVWCVCVRRGRRHAPPGALRLPNWVRVSPTGHPQSSVLGQWQQCR